MIQLQWSNEPGIWRDIIRLKDGGEIKTIKQAHDAWDASVEKFKEANNGRLPTGATPTFRMKPETE